MKHLYQKHYTREAARELLPRIREWLDRLAWLRTHLEKTDRRVAQVMAAGDDAGGGEVDTWVATMVDIRGLLGEFQKREILIKDLERGLVDFPAFMGGKEVFLCWEKDEEDVEFWHDIDSGYAGREPI